MASANVELARSIYAPWQHGDFSPVEWADPQIEFEIADGPSPGKVRGIAAMGQLWGGMLDSWEGLRAEAEEYREIDSNQVLVLTSNTGRGKMSGLELGDMRTRGANLFQFRDGKVSRLTVYWNADRALADLGLS